VEEFGRRSEEFTTEWTGVHEGEREDTEKG
jgi:hypothetical protein